MVTFEHGRQRHRHHRHEHAIVSGAARAERAHQVEIERERHHRAHDRKVGNSAQIARVPVDLRRPGHDPGGHDVHHGPDQHRPGEQRQHRHVPRRRARLHDIGHRRRHQSAERERNAEQCMRAGRRQPRFVEHQQRDPANRDARSQKEPSCQRLAQESAREQRIGHQQQRIKHRDDARSQVLFGGVDELEIERELRHAHQRRQHKAASIEPQRLASGLGQRRHRNPRDQEPPGGRPTGRDVPDLVLDDEPGRSPDQRDHEERQHDARLPEMDVRLVNHSVAIARPSAATCAGSLFQAVTSRAAPPPAAAGKPSTCPSGAGQS